MDKYRLVGPGYDALSKLYSGNAIKESKVAMLRSDTIAEGDQVLVAGAGHGADAIRAAELGADVTVVDISPTMLKALDKRLKAHPKAANLRITPILGDILKYEQYSQYDMVVCHYFLNVFDRHRMLTLLDHLCRHCKTGGQFTLADFQPAQGNLAKKFSQNLYWYAAAISFFFAAGNAVHSIYDYAPLLEERGFEILETESFDIAKLPLYYAFRAQKA